MTSIDLKKLLLGTTLISGFAVFTATPTFAQTTDTPVEVTTADDNADDEDDDNEIVVTGSRLKKSTFSSVAPLLVIDTDLATDQGLLNPVEILQTSSTAGGQQIDSSFGGFVLDNGPESETIDLRGLGANRTLVMINGRRLVPGGVEGAPTQPSINAVPFTMIETIDILTDGASSVYGSDAVAGVINVILKDDFDGLEIDISADAPEQGAGEDYTIGASYGINGDRGFIGAAVEYDYQDAVAQSDRDFWAGCDRNLEVTESGEFRSVDLAAADVANQLGLTRETSGCIPSRLTQRFIAGSFGSIYYQPGIANSFVPGFSESSLFSVPIDGNGDGEVDVAFQNFSPNGQQAEDRDIINEQKLWSAMLTGELTLEGSANVTPYFEVLYNNIETDRTSGQPQLFPFVPSNNPFNPCNINQPNGVDCNAAYNSLLLSPNYLNLFEQYYTNAELSGTDNCFGLAVFGPGVCNPANFGLLLPTGQSLTARPVIGIRGDRNRVETERTQARIVGGVKGDLPFMNFGSFKDWSFDAYGMHSWSDGTSSRSGIREDRLDYSLGYHPITGAVLNAPCEPIQGLDADIAAGCVPVNLFAPSLYEVANAGEFASQAERDYLFDSRDFDTHTSLTVFDAIIQGDVFSLPGGDVSVLLGAQFREDGLNSQPDNIARDGLFFGFFSDQGATGTRTTKELYGETFIPLGTGKPFFRELNVELAGRLTDDEFYGTNETWSAKVGYRPVDSLLFRGTAGTSFRAPNLRELFLNGQTGFGTIADPCAVPDAAYNPLTMTYNPANDTRTQVTLDNCRAAGIDPTSFLAGQFSAYSVESSAGGAKDLDPETSDSYTLGAAFEQPFTDAFDLDMGVTYYSIEIDNTVIEPGTAFIVDDCYNQQANFSSAFCSRITRDFNDPANPGVISFIDRGFINRDKETAKGWDFNAHLQKDGIAIGDRSIDVGVRTNWNRTTERNFIQSNAGVTNEDDVVGEFYFPKWRGLITPYVEMDKFRFTWSTQFVDDVTLDNDNEDLEALGLTDASGNRIFTNYVDSGNVVTCGGPARGDVNCSPVYTADDYWLHNASIRYTGDDWGLTVGVANVFDKAPPQVDPAYVFSVSNSVVGGGYDLNGREFFARLQKRF
ncbi:MAG: TonB-dependent receptor [Hellea sp.]|nr:TonB-dependent receptor [Hellea sp.]